MYWILFAVFLAACFAGGSTGALFPPGAWYRRLEKPPWTPPDWMFPVAWSILYALIAASAARIAMIPGAGLALGVFALQIALNTLWTPVFFGLRRLKGGMLVVSLLWLAVAGMIATYWPLDRIAALMLVPYLGWVTVAAALNFSVWRRNPDEKPLEQAL
jgi:benzodiazapine receptor